jgi:hypothetical protein
MYSISGRAAISDEFPLMVEDADMLGPIMFPPIIDTLSVGYA